MKKVTFYKIGALCLSLTGLGLFTAFDDAMTDEQKIEAAVEQMTTDFNMEQERLCKEQALAQAQTQWANMQTTMNEGGGEEQPTGSTGGGTYRGDTDNNGSSGEEQPTGSTSGTDNGGKLDIKDNGGKSGGGKLDVKDDGATGSGGKLNVKDDAGKSGGKLKVK